MDYTSILNLYNLTIKYKFDILISLRYQPHLEANFASKEIQYNVDDRIKWSYKVDALFDLSSKNTES